MHDAGIEACFTKRVLNGLVIDAGHLHIGNTVAKRHRLTGVMELGNHGSQISASVLDGGRLDQHAPEEVTVHPVASAYGAVDC